MLFKLESQPDSPGSAEDASGGQQVQPSEIEHKTQARIDLAHQMRSEHTGAFDQTRTIDDKGLRDVHHAILRKRGLSGFHLDIARRRRQTEVARYRDDDHRRDA